MNTERSQDFEKELAIKLGRSYIESIQKGFSSLIQKSVLPQEHILFELENGTVSEPTEVIRIKEISSSSEPRKKLIIINGVAKEGVTKTTENHASILVGESLVELSPEKVYDNFTDIADAVIRLNDQRITPTPPSKN